MQMCVSFRIIIRLAYRNILLETMCEIYNTVKQTMVEFNSKQSRYRRKWPMAWKYQALGSL